MGSRKVLQMALRRQPPKPSPPPAKPAIAYGRFSAEGQSEFSIAAQRRAIAQGAAALGYSVVAWFDDQGVSGLTLDRPGLQAAIKRARAGDVKALLVHKIDRLSRQVPDQYAIYALLERVGVKVISIAEPFDADTAMGRMIRGQMGLWAAFYSDNLSAETRKGLSQRRLAGKHVGTAPLGYEWIAVPGDGLKRSGRPRHRMVINEAEAPTVRLIYEWAEQGLGAFSICRRLNNMGLRSQRGLPWTDSTRVMRILRNPTYAALIPQEPVYHVPSLGAKRIDRRPQDCQPVPTEDWPPLIPRAQWRRVQRILETRSVRRQHPGTSYLLSGVLRCPVCGGRMNGARGGGRRWNRRYYQCRTGIFTHGSLSLPADQVERHVIEALSAEAGKGMVTVEWQHEAGASPAESADRERRGIESRLSRLQEAYLAGDFSLEEFRRHREALLTRKRELASSKRGPGRKVRVGLSSSAREALALLGDDEIPVLRRRAILGQFVETITPREQQGYIIVLRAEDANPVV